MIGKIMIGKSFSGCLKYCLGDKLMKGNKNEPVMKDRAEVILYNQCYGDTKALTSQFNEVRGLNRKLAKPVMHITLSLAKGEQLPNYKLADIAQDCANEVGFLQNQFIVVLHKDTAHPHIHIIANRVGLDGKTVSDSNNFKRIANFSRKMEAKYQLQQVASPNAFLPKDKEPIQRNDQRKQLLKQHIVYSLATSDNYQQFEAKMKAFKYEVIKKRGIAFRDEQKVYTKGSDVGFSLSKIEKAFSQSQNDDVNIQVGKFDVHRSDQKIPKDKMVSESDPDQFTTRLSVLDALFSPAQQFEERSDFGFLQKKRRRNKKQRRGL